MTDFTCSKADCPVGVTRKCLLLHTPPESCPHISVSEAPAPPAASEPETATTALFHGNELGLQHASDTILSTRYGHLVGVLGETGSGKTCLISALYLLASCGDLRPRFLFAGSSTLPGFESRLRLLRQWTGAQLPEHLVDHTRLADPRQPGLLHLRLLQSEGGLRDLLFTDLPGEWTKDLIAKASAADRFTFLRRADSIVLTFLATKLSGRSSRHAEVQAGRMILQRLRDSVGIDPELPIVFAITRCDETGLVTPPAVYELVGAAQQLGFLNASHLAIAAFSDRDNVPSGTGLGALVSALLIPPPPPTSVEVTHERGDRMFTRFRFKGEAA